MTEPKQPSWPKLPSGVTDWETVFEYPEKGLLARIAKVRTVRALRDSTIVIIKRLYARKDDPAHVEQFIADISAMLPDDTPDDVLPKMIAPILAILRQVKTERIEKAEAFVRAKEGAKSFGHQVSSEDIQPEGIERRQSSQPMPVRKVVSPTTKTRGPMFYGGVGVIALAGCVVLAYAIKFAGTDDTQLPTQQFVEQMKDAIDGNIAERHVFGGRFRVGTNGGRTFVSANRVPKEECASVAWVLINRGTVVINQTMPSRVSPRILKNACEKSGDHAEITWYPKATKARK